MMSKARIANVHALALEVLPTFEKVKFYQQSGEAARYGLKNGAKFLKVLYFLIAAIERMTLPI